MFRTNANNQAPEVFRDKGLEINSSNLCNEVYLPSTPDESFTCILSSMNLLHYDEWKDTDAVETLVYFLDAVATEFITKLEAYRDSPNRDDQLVWEYMKRAHRFTVNNRA
jgi:ribonucleoside-diphosphate reductase alpha chain